MRRLVLFLICVLSLATLSLGCKSGPKDATGEADNPEALDQQAQMKKAMGGAMPAKGTPLPSAGKTGE